MFKRLTTLALAGALSAGLLTAVLGSQGSGCLPTTGTVSGLTMTQNINAAIAALASSFSGASAPSTDCTGAPVKGQVWLDTSVTPNVMKQYDGTSWTLLGALDASNHLWAPPVGGGTATIASAAGVTDIWANVASSVTISGTNAITALANASAVPGTIKVVTAGGAFTLTNGTTIELPSGANITVASGDRFLAIAKTSTNVAVFAYTKADGSAITNPSVPIGTVLYGDWGTIPVKTVYGTGQAISRASYPDYFTAVTRVQSAGLGSGFTTLTTVSNTAGMGAGMPIEGTGIPAGTTIVSVTSSTIVMSAAATSSITTPVRVFFTGYGAGGDSTTVGVKNCIGRVLAGRDPSGSTLSSASAINSAQGVQSQNLSISQIPSHTHQVVGNTSTPNRAHTHSGILQPTSTNTFARNDSTGSSIYWSGATGSTAGEDSPYHTHDMNFTSQATGSGSALPNVQPTVTAECVVVVLP